MESIGLRAKARELEGRSNLVMVCKTGRISYNSLGTVLETRVSRVLALQVQWQLEPLSRLRDVGRPLSRLNLER